MDGYMTLREASEKWGITARMISGEKIIQLWRCSHEIIISGR